MSPSLAEVVAFVVDATGLRSSDVQAESDLYLLGVDGDDFFDLIAKFETRFQVSMAGYRWYFHHGEEGFVTPGRLLFPPPNKRVQRLPITPKLLHRATQEHRWLVEYPLHQLPHRRYDFIADRLLFGTVGAIGLALGLRHLVL